MANKIRLVESVLIDNKNILESSPVKKIREEQELPKVLYPEICAINANQVTRNKTYYPVESLVPADGKKYGFVTMLDPYPIPVIKDHETGGGFFGGEASDIFGRVIYSEFVADPTSGGYVSCVASITDEEAIKKILSDRWLTVSIGVESEWVKCSICGEDPFGPECDHKKGTTYMVNGSPKECFWIIGPVTFLELSFVTVPSDPKARIISKNRFGESLKLLATELPGGEELVIKGSKERLHYIKERWKIEEMSENVKNEGPQDDKFCTYGELFGLDESDEDYHKEAKLRAKDRKKLPDSAFCGPGRSFPAHDATHARVGLSLLGRYKGPGDKDRIRACLQRKLASFKKGGKKELFPLAKIKVGNEELEILPVSKSRVMVVAEDLKGLNASEKMKSQLIALLVKYCKENKLPIPKAYKEITPSENLESVSLDPNTDASWALPLWMDYVQRESMGPKKKKLQKEMKKQEKKFKKEAKKFENEIKELKEQVDVLNKHSVEVHSKALRRSCELAAFLSLSLNSSLAKDRSFDNLVEEFVKRGPQYVEETLGDLFKEYKESGPVPPVKELKKVEHIESPVIKEDERKPLSQLVVDPDTGKTTVDAKITEEEDETVFLYTGLSKEELQKKISERLASDRLKSK